MAKENLGEFGESLYWWFAKFYHPILTISYDIIIKKASKQKFAQVYSLKVSDEKFAKVFLCQTLAPYGSLLSR